MTAVEPPIIAYQIHVDQAETIQVASSHHAISDIHPHLARVENSGWMLLNPVTFVAIWYGGAGTESIHLQYLQDDGPRIVSSNFGYGILTWNPRHLFRTNPGWNLHARGPVNVPRRGAVPLEGIVETDWAESTFTMNWQITEPGYPIVFHAGDPFCFITPHRRGDLEQIEPTVASVHDAGDVLAAYERGREASGTARRHLRDSATSENEPAARDANGATGT